MSMTDITSAKEYGIRLKRTRCIQGLSQAELAEKVGVVGATIAKWEKEGLKNIEDIQSLSNALGHDLLQDEMNEEGTIGEIEKMLLRYLVMNKGVENSYELTGHLFEDYGLSMPRSVKELSKLQRIGLIERECYKNLYGENKDETFITAKGLITIINNNWMENISNTSAITYEKKCQGYDSYQEYLDNLNASKSVLALEPVNGFRINVINYILQKYDYSKHKYLANDFFCGRSLYEDLMYAMVQGLNRDIIDKMVSAIIIRNKFTVGNECIRFKNNIWDMKYGNNKEVREFMDNLQEKSDLAIVYDLEDPQYIVNDGIDELDFRLSSYWEMFHENIIYERYRHDIIRNDVDKDSNIEDFSDYNGNAFDYIIKKKGEDFTKWFSDEEIISFVKENVCPAETEEERHLDGLIKKIMEEDPSIVDYFVLPNYLSDDVKEAIWTAYEVPKLVGTNKQGERVEFWLPDYSRGYAGLVTNKDKAVVYDINYNILWVNLFALISIEEIGKMSEEEIEEFIKTPVMDLIDKSVWKEYVHQQMDKHLCCKVQLFADNKWPVF